MTRRARGTAAIVATVLATGIVLGLPVSPGAQAASGYCVDVNIYATNPPVWATVCSPV